MRRARVRRVTRVSLSHSQRDLVAQEVDVIHQVSYSSLVQSLNSPFFPPHIEAEPGRAKEESRITCMRMLRTPPFPPPNRGKNIFGITFQIRLVERFLE